MKINLSKLLYQATVGAQKIQDINILSKLQKDIRDIKEMLEDLDFMVQEEKGECGFEI